MTRTAFAKTIVLAAIFGAGLSGAAFARDQVFTARLAQPAAAARLIANSAVWNCEGDTCVARSTQGASVRACRQFVGEAGVAVIAYGADDAQLNEEELTRCNAAIAQTVQQARN